MIRLTSWSFFITLHSTFSSKAHVWERQRESAFLIQLANTTERGVCELCRSLSWAEGAEPAAADSSDGLVPLHPEAFDFPTRRFGGGGKCSRAFEEGWLQLQKWLQVWRRDKGFWNRRKSWGRVMDPRMACYGSLCLFIVMCTHSPGSSSKLDDRYGMKTFATRVSTSLMDSTITALHFNWCSSLLVGVFLWHCQSLSSLDASHAPWCMFLQCLVITLWYLLQMAIFICIEGSGKVLLSRQFLQWVLHDSDLCQECNFKKLFHQPSPTDWHFHHSVCARMAVTAFKMWKDFLGGAFFEQWKSIEEAEMGTWVTVTWTRADSSRCFDDLWLDLTKK